jgi:hypothetical protein
MNNPFDLIVLGFTLIFLLIALWNIPPVYPLAWIRKESTGRIKSIRFEFRPNLLEVSVFLFVACLTLYFSDYAKPIAAELKDSDFTIFWLIVGTYLIAMIAAPFIVLLKLIRRHKQYLADTLEQVSAELDINIKSIVDLRFLTLDQISKVLARIESSGILEVSRFDGHLLDTGASVEFDRFKVFLPLDIRHNKDPDADKDDVRGGIGIQGSGAKQEPMFATRTSQFYPKYLERDKDTLACTWLYCLHNNIVMDKLIIKLRSNLVLDPNKANVEFFLLSMFWPIFLLKYLIVTFFAVISVISKTIGNALKDYVEKYSV